MAQNPPSISAGGSSPQKTTGTAKPVIKLSRLDKLRADPKTRAQLPDSALTPEQLQERQRLQGAATGRRLANPGERSKLPDSALTPEQLAQRQTNAYNAAPAAPGSSLTNAQMKALVDAGVIQKYGGQQQQIQAQAQAIPEWFKNYRDQIAGAQATQKTGGDALVGSLNTMADNAKGDLGTLAGAPMDAAGAARAQAAANIRSAGIGNQAALATNLNGIQGNFLTNQGILSQGQQAAAVLANSNAGAQLAKDKGAYATTLHDQILSNEADSALKNALTTAQIGSTNATAANTAATTTKTKVDTSKSQADQAYFDKHGYYPGTGKPAAKTGYGPGAPGMNKYGYTYDEWAGLPADKQASARKGNGKAGQSGKGPNWLPASGQGSAQTDLGRANTYAAQLKKGGKSRAEAAQYLTATANGTSKPVYEIDPKTHKKVPVLVDDGKGNKVQKTSDTGSWAKVSSAIASVALDEAYVGHVSPATIRKLIAAGIKPSSIGVKAGTSRPAQLSPAQRAPGGT